MDWIPKNETILILTKGTATLGCEGNGLRRGTSGADKGVNEVGTLIFMSSWTLGTSIIPWID